MKFKILQKLFGQKFLGVAFLKMPKMENFKNLKNL